MNWHDFQEEVPDLAIAGATRFRQRKLAFIATLARDGSPRISPIEPMFMGKDLVLAMIWQSRKALDVLRDPRFMLHSIVTHPEANEGEFKLRGRAAPADEPTYDRHIRKGWGIAASQPLHVFRAEILSASLTTYDFTQSLMIVELWDPIHGVTKTRRPYP